MINSNEDDDIRKCVIILQSSSVQIPKGLEPYVELIEVPKLKDDEICEIIVDFAKDRGEVPYDNLLQPLIVNLRGFNTRKIKDILNRLYLHCQGLFTIKCEEEGIKLIRTVKEQMLKKEGLLKLKYVDKNTYVSGLDQLTEWLVDRAELFRDPIKAETQWNLSTPKSILVSGVPGTGKSALANQIAMVFDLPILQFDMGSVLGKYSGESEANMRKVLKLAESMSPCVLWIDEIEKAFSSASSSGDSDGGQG
ncbi:MAG: AAA family ATPase, partial [Muribaculaceae bacterium]|nr:AAA family ATPase [Muribaculaceae bacterium]